MSFALGLAWHFSKASLEKDGDTDGKSEVSTGSGIAVFESKEPTPDENSPLPEISSEELAFRERAEKVLSDFPSKELLKDPKRELHRPPPELAEVGAELGAIEDLLDSYPHLNQEGLRFYRKCALKVDLLTSVRALCLHNLKIRAQKTGRKIREKDFPDQLHRLADKL